jgi:hypothetical protein
MLEPMLSRRRVLGAMGVGCAALASPGLAFATTARAITLPELVGLSQFALVGTATDAYSRWETMGRSRRIVTYTRVEVTQPIDGRPPPDTSLLVRTLGGRVGDIGQLVHGEARFELGASSVVFITPDDDGVFGITAMAQGHYPLGIDPDAPDTAVRLRASPNIPALTRVEGSAVQRLVRRTVVEAESLVSGIMHPR